MRKPHLGIVVGGTVAALVLVFLLGVLLPVTDSAVGSEAEGAARRYSAEQVTGRKIYIREGCFTCHTMMVRDSVADLQLGPRVSEPGDYFNEAPHLIGADRVGPDLTCAGTRQSDAGWHVRHLRSPSSVREGSAMPPYGHLSARELRALASYLTALTCEAEES